MENIKLVKAREEKGYTVKQMADMLGIDRSTYYRYEKGIRKINIEMLKRIALILEISIEKII